MSTHGTDQYLVQRYLCTDRPKRAAAALLTSGAIVLGQFIGFLFIGVLLFAFYHPYTDPGYAAASVAAYPFSGGDRVFPDFITRHLPTACRPRGGCNLRRSNVVFTQSIAATR